MRGGRLSVVLIGFAWLVAFGTLRPSAQLAAGRSSLAHIALEGATQVDSAIVTWGRHQAALAVGPAGSLTPRTPIPAGVRVDVRVTVSTPAWLAWAPGEVRVLSQHVRTPPAPALAFHHEAVAAGAAVLAAFTRAGQVRGLAPRPLAVVPDRDIRGEAAEAQHGVVDVETRGAPWEAWSPPAALSWSAVPVGSTILALQRDLAQLGYLPLRWVALAPGVGRFVWRYPLPPSLTALWTAGRPNVLTTGAVWQFERETGLPVQTPTNALFWRDLDAKLAAGDQNTEGYTYVQVSQGTPERLRLWFNGQLVVNSLANTAKPPGVTHVGTFPVFLRYPSQSMRGFDPSTGRSYYYPNVPWVNYFKGNDAVHGFPRQRYGFPQSAGCVELPIATAKVVYGYMHYGTLVTVLPIPRPS